MSSAISFKLDHSKILSSVNGLMENIVGKGGHAAYHYFLLC